MNKLLASALIIACCAFGTGCVAVKVADTAASATVGAAVGVTKVAVKGTTAAAKAVIPNKKKKKK